jgi:hypothetical protein
MREETENRKVELPFTKNPYFSFTHERHRPAAKSFFYNQKFSAYSFIYGR